MNGKILKYLDAILQFSVAGALLGVSMKVMHWPYATLVLICSSAIFALIYPIKFWFVKEKRTTDYLKLVLALFWGIGTLLTSLNVAYSSLINYITLGVFLIWFLFRGIEKNSGISSVLFILSVIFVGLGCIFRFLQWPGVPILFGIGILIGCLWVVIGLFSPKHKNKSEIDDIGKS